ncbi:Uncharacterized protein dnl_60990 [Desulfonema limicola]|uniref:Gingipain propeptide domain-containing protein n=1 Tax=Desulfonema limicola TaxID=45656 RepID=A0A975GJN8_9BACT|nr:C25 family peptidase propeptide domain-containing protein [Desulfonema limicola]QTA83685.1 Uncharacterized protein dnl_60990 [Desulfonema limicola]
MKNLKIFFMVSFLMTIIMVCELQAAEQTYNFKTPVYTADTVDNIHHLSIKNYYSYPVPGYPDLPSKIYRFAIPPDAVESSIKVDYTVSETEELGSFNISEVSPMMTRVDGKEIIGKKADIYNVNAYFPKKIVEYMGLSQMRKWKIVTLQYTPFQYNPVTGQLKYFSSVSVTIKYAQDRLRTSVSDIDDDIMDSRAREVLNNFSETYNKWYKTSGKPARSSKQDYVIITTNAIKTASTKLNDFKNYLMSKGYSPLIVTESDYGTLTGQLPNGKADKIRKWLQNNYSEMGIKYLLLIGNPDPSNGDVPMKMCWPRRGEYDYYEDRDAPTDYYYADLTGNWDKDGDGYFGEYPDDSGTGGVDFMNEVYVGRIPVYNNKVSSLDSVLLKTIAYGSSTDIAWRKNVLLPMSFSDGSTDGAYLSEAMTSDYLNSAGYASWKMYMQGSLCSSADSDYMGNSELVDGSTKLKWKNNPYGMVWWWGHGSETGAYLGYEGCGWETILSSYDASSLDNEYPAFVYQCSCLNGYPENPDNLGTALLYNGAITTLSSSRVSWYGPGIWNKDNQYLCDNASIGYYYGKELINNKKSGEALFAVKSNMGKNHLTWWDGCHWMNLFDFNLYGDPSVGINESTTGPANNNFISASAISSMSGQTSGSNDKAGKETGEPNHAGNSGGKSVWWKWTAPQTNYFNFDTHGSTFNTLLAVYTGSSVGSLTLISSNDDDKSASNASGLTFQAQSGSTYYIAVDGYNGVSGSIILNWRTSAPSSLQITGASSLNENSGVQYSCTAFYEDGSSVDITDKAAWSENSSYAVISSTGYLTASSVNSNQSVDVKAEYQGISKTYPVSIIDVLSLPNNNFSNASEISGVLGQTEGSNTSADKETGEPDHAGDPGGKSVWWKWTSPGTVDVFLDTHGSDFDTVLAVYKGSSLNALTESASNNNYSGGTITSSVMFPAQAGVTYYIAVDGAGGSSGNIFLNWKIATPSTLSVSGLSQINEGNNAQYTSIIYYTDGSSSDVSTKAIWSETCDSASISNSGRLSTSQVSDDQSCTITAVYQGKTALYNITIINISNDNFTQALTISGISGGTAGSNLNAGKETGEPDHAYNSGGSSLWWKWTAPESGYMLFNTYGSNFDTLLAVYTGTTLAELNELGSSDDDGSPDNNSGVVVQVQAGITYYIAVDGYDGSTGNIVLNWEVPVSENDNFVNAKLLTGLQGSEKSFNIDAAKEAGEPNHAGEPGGSSVWWKWTPQVSSYFGIDTYGSSFDTILAVYIGNSVDSLTEITSNDDDPYYDVSTSYIEFFAEAGTTYYIAVDGYEGDQGSISLWWYGLPPVNDDFDNARSISDISGNNWGDNFSASTEDGEPYHAGEIGGSSAWWTWTAPQNGFFYINTHGSDFDTLLGVYTGTDITSLSEITSNDDDGSSNNTSGISFNAVSGTTYYIAVDGYGGLWGNIVINWGLAELIANDNFTDASPINGISGSVSASNQYATKENEEPYHAGNEGGKSLWWKWTAPETSFFTFDGYGSDFYDTVIAVYTGTSLSDLTQISANLNDNGLTFKANAGTIYYIAVDGYYDSWFGNISSGNIFLNWRKANPPLNDNFINANLLTGISGNATGTTKDATGEIGEPEHENFQPKRTVWWKWISPSNNRFIFDTYGSDLDTILAVYSGSNLSTLLELAGNDDSSDLTSEVSFQAVSGNTYYIVVSGFSGDVGNIFLNWKLNTELCIPGDVNGNGTCDLADTITALQVLCNIPVSVCNSSDVSGDSIIGIEEAVFSLKYAASNPDGYTQMNSRSSK